MKYRISHRNATAINVCKIYVTLYITIAVIDILNCTIARTLAPFAISAVGQELRSIISIIMGREYSFEGALYFTKMSVYLARTWPPPIVAAKGEIIQYNFSWCITFLSILGLFFPLIYSICKFSSNSLIVTKSACFVCSTSNVMIKMIVYRIHFKRTQTLIHEMEEFVANALPHEKIVLRRYMDRCSNFHLFISILNNLAVVMVMCGPFVLSDQLLLTSAAYPFSVNSGIVWYILYLHQTVAGFQCSSGVTIDCQAALMMWFAGARLEILAEEFKNISNVRVFKLFVQKHRKLLAYAVEVSKTTSYVVFASSMTCGIAAIMSSLQLFGNQPFVVKLQFGIVTLIGTMNYFTCAWPADNLINVCDLVGNAVYNSQWDDMSLNMMKNILIVSLRCRQPVIVSVPGFLPILSLQSYASFVSTILSYMTTLRAVVSSDTEK